MTEPCSPSHFANERALNRFWVKDPSYGAVVDGVTDDSAAIQSAINACGAAGGGSVLLTAGTSLINSPLTISSEDVKLIGAGRGFNAPTSILKAGAAMYSMVNVRVPTALTNVFFDGFYLATHCVVRGGDVQTRYDNVFADRALSCGFYASGNHGDVTFNVVRDVGTSPNPTAVGPYFSSGLFTGLFIQFVSGGGLGVATYRISSDAGASFGPTLTVPASGVLEMHGGGQLVDLGIQLTFVAHTYATNDQWHINPNATRAINDTSLLSRCFAQLCGTVYWTAGMPSFYGGRAITVGGTVTTTLGSNVVPGSGTTWLSTKALPGDFLVLYDSLSGDYALVQILCVVDDVTILTAGNALTSGGIYPTLLGHNIYVGGPPSRTWNNYAVTSGSGYYEEISTNNDLTQLDSCIFDKNATAGILIAGLYGATVRGGQYQSSGVAGIVWGTRNNGIAPTSGTIVNPYFEGNGFFGALLCQGNGIQVLGGNTDGATQVSPLSSGTIARVSARGNIIGQAGGTTTTNRSDGAQLGIDSGRPQIATVDIAGTLALRSTGIVVSNGSNGPLVLNRSINALENATLPYTLSGILVDDWVPAPGILPGFIVLLVDVTGQSWTISHQSGAAGVGRRFYCPGAADISMPPYGTAICIWIEQFNSWLVVQMPSVLQEPIFRVNHAGSPYNLTASQLDIFADSSAGTIVLNVPIALADGTPLRVTDSTGHFATNTVTVNFAGAEKGVDPNTMATASSIILTINNSSTSWVRGSVENSWRLR